MPTFSYQIARATTDDVDAITPLFDAYRQFYNQRGEAERTRCFLADRPKTGQSVIFVCHAIGNRAAALGFTQLFPIFSSISIASAWILNDLYVVPASRRAGVGRSLLAAAHESARTSGAIRIELVTQRENKAAQLLYESLGYREDSEFRRYSLALRSVIPQTD